MKNLLIIWLLFISSSVLATDYTVASQSELESVLQKVRPGDTIIWKNGTYTNLKIDFSPVQNGTRDHVIFLKAETAGKVILKGSSRLFIGGDYLQASGFVFEGTSTLGEREDVICFRSDVKKSRTANFSRVTNCKVTDYTPLDHTINFDWIILYGTHNEIDHCSFSGKYNQGPYLVVAYDKPKGFVDGSDMAPSTYHHIHHNYFGKRNMPTDNGGECMRIGDSKTSMTKGFNLVEHNYFEGEENEPEVISNKSCDNVYRFNSFYNNDGALVLRHGNRCIVYGNYINGKSGRGFSGGIRVIGEDHTVFNNYLENQEGGKENLKAPITIMGGIPASPLNGYFAADRAIIAFNTIVNAVGPVIHMGAYAKTETPVAPKDVVFAQNLVINPKMNNALLNQESGAEFKILAANFYVQASGAKGFINLSGKELKQEGDLWFAKKTPDVKILALIYKRLESQDIHLNDTEITVFNPAWMLQKKDVGVQWINL